MVSTQVPVYGLVQKMTNYVTKIIPPLPPLPAEALPTSPECEVVAGHRRNAYNFFFSKLHTDFRVRWRLHFCGEILEILG